MNYGYYPQQFTPATTGYKQPVQYPSNSWGTMSQVRPVTSIEEVRAYPIDFDGSIFYFPDMANKKIYTKFINVDGTVTINVYELKELNTGQAADASYVTRQEFENVITQLKEMFETNIQERVDATATATQQQMYQF